MKNRILTSQIYILTTIATLFFLSTVFTFTSCTHPNQIKTINVQDYGIEANTKQCITSDINKLIESLGDEAVEIVFPKGRYDFYPDSNYLRPYYETNTYDVNPKRLAILLDKKKNITIDAQGSDFIYHGHIQPFTLDNSENITIKNVNIDWDIPLTAEAKVVEADAKHILLKIDESQFPYSVNSKSVTFKGEDWEEDWRLSGGSWLIEYNTEHIIPAHTGGHGCVNGDLDNVNYSLTDEGLLLMEGDFTKTPGVGNYLILRHSTRDHAGMFLFHSKNIHLENINVYHTSGLGILSQYCENIEMRNVNMIPNKSKNRFLAGHDDGLHFMGCKGDIIIDDCDAQGLMDDPINIHGTCIPVLEKLNNKTVKCQFAHSMSCGLQWAEAGDTVGFLDKKSMSTIAKGVVSKIDYLNKDSLVIEFEQAVPKDLNASYSIENLSWTPNATITNCFVGSCRARGYLISTPGKVLIENNVFETSGSAILIAGDANYWYESGAVTDVTIRNNEFRWSCNSSYYQFCNAIISIFPEIPEPDSKRPFHKNIRIENNTFNPADYPILYALSVDGLSFKNNTITRSYDYEPWHFQKHSFLIDACQNVEISGNIIGDNVLGKNILLQRMSEDELKLNNGELTISNGAE
ncbi:right-handed parallel beta-helix repeat-containing protein [Carboxylicivirga sp. M1479]|uniref:alpha-1,3-galactosidase-related protein n=1 Tax=Carboxylicivirga sp. M1479 TaxID=2594476 RepID=UPI001177E9CA|nr:right-handed parallel beta-helix repeat-containing protein [Carboxylicivirga sp. M1479]TRX71237.1 alpha-1,3-galactosidase B [Carboxylicivirga sp. M1479]